MTERIPAEVFPPGEFIKEEIDARGWMQQDLAEILGKPLPTVNQILSGKKAVLPETARRLAAAFGNSAQFWMNLEASWQLHRSPASPESDRVRSMAKIYDLVPIREMEKRGWIRRRSNHNEREAELRRFFAVDDLDSVPTLAAAARASIRGGYAGMTAAQWAWCMRASQLSSAVSTRAFRRDKIKHAVEELRLLMRDPEEIRHVPRVLAVAGIRLVIVERLNRTKMDGAALWPTGTTPVIAMSLRFGRLDSFWFTLMHELAHIYNRDGIQADADMHKVKISEVAGQAEVVANRKAAAWLVDQAKLDSFILRTTPHYSTERIRNFSRRMGVHPAIIVGQLKFRSELDWTRFSRVHVDVRRTIQEVTLCDGWGRTVPLGDA